LTELFKSRKDVVKGESKVGQAGKRMKVGVGELYNWSVRSAVLSRTKDGEDS